jgi:hypothetical protein
MCAENSLACRQDSAGLAIALLGSKDSADGLSALVALVRFRLDGSNAENHTCYVLGKGRRIVPLLKQASPQGLADRCLAEWKAAAKSNPSLLAVHPPESVCASQSEIAGELDVLANAVNAGERCAPEDF